MGLAAGCSAVPGQPAVPRHPTVKGSANRTPSGSHAAKVIVTATTRKPEAGVSLLTRTATGELTARFAQTVFAASPVVVVAAGTAGTGTAGSAGSAEAGHSATAARTKPRTPPITGLTPRVDIREMVNARGGTRTESVAGRAGQAALDAHAPLLLAAKITPGLAAGIRRLHPKTVLAEGLSLTALSAALPGIHVVGAVSELPATAAPAPLSKVAVLLHVPVADPEAARKNAAITVTAEAAGATVVPVRGWDPRADPAAIRTLARLRPADVIGIGGGFGPVARLRSRLAVAATGVQLPGGGQVLFPGRRLVALYGHPYTPSLGALGEQGLQASIARAKKMAALYRPLSKVPVVPAFEIIATVAEGSPGPAGTYSYETPVSQLRPWVRAATKAGMYVVLDLQPGRASLLAQAKVYAPLLRLPNVGLALDSEWKLQPGQLPLRQIGHVTIGEVNSVVTWLATLTARYHLPQKLLVLHQFQLQMIRGEQYLDTRNDDLAIVIHMDGQGTPAMKQQTWDAITQAAPPGVFFGWKNFFVKDHPMLTPSQTMAETPTPVMISYQLRMPAPAQPCSVPGNEVPPVVF